VLYPGVPDEVVVQLGRLAIAAGQLEAQARLVALAEGSDPGRRMLGGVLDGITDAIASRGMPPWARLESDALISWCKSARELANERNEVFHSNFWQMWDGDTWQPHREHLRSQANHLLDVEALAALVERVAAVRNDGVRLWNDLLPQLAPGQFARLGRNDEGDLTYQGLAITPEAAGRHLGRGEIDDALERLAEDHGAWLNEAWLD
jgi:hypothetical protein